MIGATFCSIILRSASNFSLPPGLLRAYSFKPLFHSSTIPAHIAAQEVRNLKNEISGLNTSILRNVENATDLSNIQIKEGLIVVIKAKKKSLKNQKQKLENLESTLESDRANFMSFALDFISDTGKYYLDSATSMENRIRCKQMLFPEEIFIDAQNKVHIPKISVFYRLATNEKDTEVPSISQMVPHFRRISNHITR